MVVLSGLISAHRLTVLQDRTPVSYCRIKEFWDSSGTLLLQTEAAFLSRYRNRDECPQEQGSPDISAGPRVIFHDFKVYPDSIVIGAETIRTSGAFTERYFIRRIGRNLMDSEYSLSLGGIVSSGGDAVRAIGNIVTQIRLTVLQDRTPVSYCSVDELWDSRGALLLQGEVASLSKYKNRTDCPEVSEYQDYSPGTRVTIGSARVYPDSIVVSGLTRRGARYFPERYLILRAGDTLMAPEYLVWFIGIDDYSRGTER